MHYGLKSAWRACFVGLLLMLMVPGCAWHGASEGSAGGSDETVRDRLWIWSHPTGAHDTWGGIERPSNMGPTEGAQYMGLENLYFIKYEGRPAISEYDKYAQDMAPMKRVIWSLTGASGETSEADRAAVLKLAEDYGNIRGFILDDFLYGAASDEAWGEDSSPVPAAMTPEELRQLRGETVINGERLPIVCVVYTHQISPRILPHVNEVDKVAMWTWFGKDLEHMETELVKLEKVVGDKPILLGCYLYDYGASKAMPVEWMKYQCDLGLKWLKEGRIEGMIFLATNVVDIDLEAVEWTRQWIKQVGDERLGS